jgi:hypothetical protein
MPKRGQSVDVSREVPEPWASALVAAKLTDPRNGKPSMRALAAKARTTTTTISAMMYGERETKNDVVERVTNALGMEDRVVMVMGWVDRERTQARPFSPHPDANLLTTDEQEAINEIIRLMALPKKRERGVEGAEHPAANTGAASRGARERPPRSGGPENAEEREFRKDLEDDRKQDAEEGPGQLA